MKGSKPSPADKTQLRITKDKQELQRLIKEAQKHLVEGHSPAIYDYLDYRLAYLEDPIKASTKIIDNNVSSTWNMADDYFTDAEKEIVAFGSILDADVRQALKDAEERNIGFATDLATGVTSYILRSGDTIVDTGEGLFDDVRDRVKRDEDIIVITFDDEADKAKDDLEEAEQNSPGFWGSTWDAFTGFPAFMVNIQKMLDGLVNIDPEKFIEDNIELTKAHKKLQQRLVEEGI